MSGPTVLIAEDEPALREQLARLLDDLWPEARVVARCANGHDALAALTRFQPQVLFLDIRMPGPDGLAVAQAASGRAHVVLTTAFEEYALRAFEAGALDYLLKPVVPERLAATITRLRERLAEAPPAIEHLLQQVRQQMQGASQTERLTWITASAGNEVRLLAVDDVLYFQASDKYVRVVTGDDEALVRMSLKALSERLDPEVFWQIHRSVIVSVAAIDKVERDELGRMWALIRGRADRLPINAACRQRFRGM